MEKIICLKRYQPVDIIESVVDFMIDLTSLRF